MHQCVCEYRKILAHLTRLPGQKTWWWCMYSTTENWKIFPALAMIHLHFSQIGKEIEWKKGTQRKREGKNGERNMIGLDLWGFAGVWFTHGYLDSSYNIIPFFFTPLCEFYSLFRSSFDTIVGLFFFFQTNRNTMNGIDTAPSKSELLNSERPIPMDWL